MMATKLIKHGHITIYFHNNRKPCQFSCETNFRKHDLRSNWVKYNNEEQYSSYNGEKKTFMNTLDVRHGYIFL